MSAWFLDSEMSTCYARNLMCSFYGNDFIYTATSMTETTTPSNNVTLTVNVTTTESEPDKTASSMITPTNLSVAVETGMPNKQITKYLMICLKTVLHTVCIIVCHINSFIQ